MEVVLVISEEPAIREALAAALADDALVLAESGLTQALRRLVTLHPDIIILDDAPMLGLSALPQVRQAAPGVPIVVIASRGDTETRANFLVAGANACVPKPFSCDSLIAAMHGLRSATPIEVAAVPSRQSATTESVPDRGLTRHQTALRWLSRATAHLDDPQRLAQALCDALTDVFDPVRCAVLMEHDGAVQVVASHGIETALATGVRFNFGVGLMRHFEISPSLVDRDTASSGPVEKQMALLGARLAVPLICSGTVVGALLVGEKSSGSTYSAEDRDLLALIARAGGIALDYAHRYRQASNRQDQLDSILAHMASGIAVVAADKTVILLNESAERILKLRATEAVGRSVQKLGSRIADIALRCLAEGAPILRHEIYDPAVGDTIGISASPLAGNGVVLVFSRIPKTHTAPDEVTYSPYWEYLSARVAQEIKNPLVAINTFAQLFPKKYDSEEFRNQFGEVVQKEVERINRVVETLFDFARHPRLEVQPTPVAETLKRVLDSFGEKLRAAGISLQFDCQLDNLVLQVDPIYFSQAVHNVVQNAVDAMPGGGTLSVTARIQNEELEILIADSGPGIPDDIVPLIFLPFYGTREYGMGLGLAVAGRIASQHGGRLDLTKHKDGCTFSLRIPLQNKERRAANPAEGGRAHATTG